MNLLLRVVNPFVDHTPMEKFHLNFCRYGNSILQQNFRTTNQLGNMVVGRSEMFPLKLSTFLCMNYGKHRKFL